MTTTQAVSGSNSRVPGLQSTARPSQPAGRFGPSGTRRASIACMSCRERRTRCDGDGRLRKQCTHCLQAKRACEYQLDDGRKRDRVDLRRLQDRIAALERGQNLVSVGAPLEEPPPPKPTIIRPDAAQHTSHVAALAVQEDPQSLIQVLLDFPAMQKDFSLVKLQAWMPSPEKPAFSISPAATKSELYLSADDSGQYRYFGYTSNMQVVSIIPPISSPTSADSRFGEDTAEQQVDSPALQKSLVDLYFKYQNPALPILEQDVFMEAWEQGGRSEYFSKFLLHAVLGRAYRLIGDPVTPGIVHVLQSRIKADLLNELEDPAIATIQGLCLFGHFLGSLGDDRGCWMYPGMAFRLLFDLGLHRDCVHLVQAKKITEKDRQVRLTTLWGCYILDKIYCVCQGRPSAVRLEDISAPRPRMDTEHQQNQNLAAFVELSTILNALIVILNGPPESLEEEATMVKLSSVGEELASWLQHLPPSLQWDKQALPTPGVCALHMQAISAIVLLHRPFTDYSHSDDQRRRKVNLPGYSGVASGKICVENAVRLAKMILAFRKRYGIQKIFSVGAYIALTAAMSLITDLSFDKHQSDDEEKRKALRICVDALKDLGLSFPVAGRHHAVLMSILNYCGLREYGNEERVDSIPEAPTEEPQAQSWKAQPTNNGPEVRTTALDDNLDFSSWLSPQINDSGWLNDWSDFGSGVDLMDFQQLVQPVVLGLGEQQSHPGHPY